MFYIIYCVSYIDGTPTPWGLEKTERIGGWVGDYIRDRIWSHGQLASTILYQWCAYAIDIEKCQDMSGISLHSTKCIKSTGGCHLGEGWAGSATWKKTASLWKGICKKPDDLVICFKECLSRFVVSASVWKCYPVGFDVVDAILGDPPFCALALTKTRNRRWCQRNRVRNNLHWSNVDFEPQPC